ncbi:MAG: S66 peptidase family protein [Gaiellaceae bacterium]
MGLVKPPALREGDAVAVVAPAGPIERGQLDRGLSVLASWGLRPVVMPNVHESTGYLAGPDDARLADLVSAWRDASIAALVCARGGYGVMRIVDRFDYALAAANPKAFVGFSDITAFHLALLKRARLVTFYGPMVGMDEELWSTEAQHQTLRRMLMGEAETGPLAVVPKPTAPKTLVPGIAEGTLIGGNLSLLAASIGGPDQPDTDGAILVLDEWGEPPYRIDRLLTQLARANLLGGIAGLLLGDVFSTAGQSERERADVALAVRQIEAVAVPTVLGFPIGHSEALITLPLGVRARLDATSCTLELLEMPTAEGEF